MRATLLGSFLLFLAFNTFAQQPLQRSISLKRYGSDSLHIPFDAAYYLVEDSCAQIMRQVRYNAQQRSFYGRFKDVSRTNPALVIAEGTYKPGGLKEGAFTSYHPNGKLQAQGSFKENKLSGEWRFFYEVGTPRLTFIASDSGITITDAWNSNGIQTVTNGTGQHQIILSSIIWKGKLLNGKPVGTWTATSPYDRSSTMQASEKFKDGKFMKGTGPIGDYTDESRIMWFNMQELPFLTAEQMAISSTPCNPAPRKLLISAQYREGLEAYSYAIQRVADAYLSGIDLKPYESMLNIEGEIAEDGRLVNMRYKNAFNDKIATGLVRALGKLPSLEPALVNGTPTRQKFTITFKFEKGFYSFNYRFLPLNPVPAK
ncbi:toxin-antitoxin system YwqK family antitoxin [Pontibacter liquoris]|uniref:toxin-antitoxin system YwqK family antitoxin n=1 Tax=Pontibacter liquoris TaxID=2905677 RepID=UPI001FA778BD|nr:hypothetical protein [Pontibacter liquoris]